MVVIVAAMVVMDALVAVMVAAAVVADVPVLAGVTVRLVQVAVMADAMMAAVAAVVAVVKVAMAVLDVAPVVQKVAGVALDVELIATETAVLVAQETAEETVQLLADLLAAPDVLVVPVDVPQLVVAVQAPAAAVVHLTALENVLVDVILFAVATVPVIVQEDVNLLVTPLVLLTVGELVLHKATHKIN